MGERIGRSASGQAIVVVIVMALGTALVAGVLWSQLRDDADDDSKSQVIEIVTGELVSITDRSACIQPDGSEAVDCTTVIVPPGAQLPAVGSRVEGGKARIPSVYYGQPPGGYFIEYVYIVLTETESTP